MLLLAISAISTIFMLTSGDINCYQNHKCRQIQLCALRTTVQSTPASFSFFDDTPQAYSLDGIPLTFIIPPYLNSSQAESDYGQVQLSIIKDDLQVVNCLFKSDGVKDVPYNFKSCDDPSYTIESSVTARNATLLIISGFVNRFIPTIISMNIVEVQNCIPENPSSYGFIQDTSSSSNLVIYGIFNSFYSVFCSTFTITTTSSFYSSAISTQGVAVTSAPSVPSLLQNNTPSSSFFDRFGAIIIGAVGGFAAITFFLLLCFYYRYKKNKKLAKDLEAASRTGSIILKDYTDTQLFPGFEEQHQFSSSKLNLYDGTDEPGIRRKPLDPAECTLLNTKAVIALPGFLKLDFSTVRPDKVIAEGGGGVVYEGELLDERLQAKHRVKKVVIKLVKNTGQWSQEDMKNMFNQEVSIMWSLNFHENIVKLIGYTEEPFALIMKFYSQSLAELINNSPEYLDDDLVTRFSYHVVHALTEMHSLSVVHRDLKTGNLLIDAPMSSEPSAWKIVVCDFGLAKFIGSSAVKASIKVDVQGISCRYAGPEVFARVYVQHAKALESPEHNHGTISDKISPSVKSKDNQDEGETEMKGDVYAFSIILWEMLAKKMCWSGLSNEEIEFQVREGNRPEINEEMRKRTVDSERMTCLLEIMENSWQQDPETRPPFSAIRSALRKYYDEMPQFSSSARYSHRFSQIDIRRDGSALAGMTTTGSQSRSGIFAGGTGNFRERAASHRPLIPHEELSSRRRYRTQSGAIFK